MVHSYVFFTTPVRSIYTIIINKCYPRGLLTAPECQIWPTHFIYTQVPKVPGIPFNVEYKKGVCANQTKDPRTQCSLYNPKKYDQRTLRSPKNLRPEKDFAKMAVMPPNNAAVMQNCAGKKYASLAPSVKRWQRLPSAVGDLYVGLEVSVNIHQPPFIFPLFALLVVADLPWLVERREPIIELA